MPTHLATDSDSWTRVAGVGHARPDYADASEGRGRVQNWQLWKPWPGTLVF